jgi:glycosyltransferase involved in cell wall biosynthesis
MSENVCFSSLDAKTAESALRRHFPEVAFEFKDSSTLRRQGVNNLFTGFHTHERSVLFVYDLNVQTKLFQYSLILLWLSRRGAYLADGQDKIEKLSWAHILFRTFPAVLRQIVRLPFELAGIRRSLRRLETALKAPSPAGKKPPVENPRLAYLRTDLAFGIRAGGSVGHVAGVIDGFLQSGASVRLISTDSLELVNTRKTRVSIVRPDSTYNFLAELPQLHFNRSFADKSSIIIKKEKPNLIYQRYSLNNYSGVALAREFNLPLILEYNGSEVWVGRNWGKRLNHEKLSLRIEQLNFLAADLIVVVSQPLKDELTGRGIPAAKILVNPNGVDPQRYRPEIDGSAIRRRYGLEGRTVAGFIGTFGNWHGAEVLAAAAVKLVKELNAPPDLHFLFIGDGVKMPDTRKIIEQGGVAERVTFTGLVPQDQGPEYLAACDFFIAPHVPNPDGSPFFGSPTKLFEYMAMGRGIVASRLDQIAEVLEHGKTAFMVEPGRVESLAEGILALVRDKALRDKLGANARAEALAKYTWKEHVAKTASKLKEVLGDG